MTRPSLLWLLTALGCSGGADSADSGAGEISGAAPPPLEPFTALRLEADALGLSTSAPVGFAGPGIAAGDLDGDGDDDLAWVSPRGWGMILWGDGAGGLEIGPPLPAGNGVSAADPDGDGDLDLLVLTDDEDLLLWNDGAGAFTESPLVPGDARMSVSASWGDGDGDGDLDLFVARYDRELNGELVLSDGGEGDGNQVFWNDGAGELRADDGALDDAARRGLTFHGGWLDVDGDLDLDLYVVNDFGATATPNRLLENDGGALKDASGGCGCALALFGMGLGVGDPDNDLDLDLFVTNLGPPKFLQNQGDGSFAEAGLATGLTVPDDALHDASWGASFVDVDLDGWEDLLVAFGQLDAPGTQMADWLEEHEDVVFENAADQPDVLLHNQAGEGFRDAAAEVGFDDPSVTRAIAIAQLDADPQPEIVTVGLDFLSVYDPGPTPFEGLVLTLDAGEGNRFGIGARVDLEVGGRAIRRWMMPTSQGSFSASTPRIFVGLGEIGVGTLTVTWPDGSISEVGEVGAGATHVERGRERR